MTDQFALSKKTNSLIAVDPAAVAAAESVKAKIQAHFIMALQAPRNETQAREKILEACRRPEFAERVEYSRQQGMKKDDNTGKWVPNMISGLGIRFTEVALKEWGNVLVDTQVLYEDDNIRRIKVTATDCETNASFGTEIQIKKTVERRSAKGRTVVGERVTSENNKVFIVVATDEEVQNKTNALVSKAVRNEGLRLIPSDIKDEAVRVARETLASDFSHDPSTSRKNIVTAFDGFGVSESDLERYLGHPVSKLTAAGYQDLKSIYRAIRDGEATADDYFGKWESQSSEIGQSETGGDPSGIEDFNSKCAGLLMEKQFDAFLSMVANEYMMTVDEVKISATEDIVKFKNMYHAWKADQAGDPEPDDQSDQNEADFETEWIRLGGPGFEKYCDRLKNQEKFKNCSRELLEKAIDKYERLVGKPFPVTMVKTEVVNGGEDAQAVGIEKTGDDKQGKQKTALERISEVMETHPKIYLKITDGRRPKTENEAKIVLYLIDEELSRQSQEQTGIPGA
jgi:hypothetical protein